ncbi:hypothetical protein [Staphylococcus shinii]|uniref:XRE family transcriptional regulator n=1 Tax=Staphylococcus shinii TaxID=2912228 RepID=A0A418IH82_9STAP|nr:hypothetical protein [Staphylococcus shinii]RIN01964.1 hypothetical protein BU112_04040 [Staphylococcus shinii]RIN10200.1 hypothetical protein BU101_00425 [Staphylococcus shinii]
MNQIEAKTIQKYICHELMNLRKNKNFKERDIALVLDIGITDLLEIEKGKNSTLPLPIYMQLCDLYNIELEQVIYNAKKKLAIDRGYSYKD